MTPPLRKGLQILSLPEPLAENPYQRLLYEACEDHGAELMPADRSLWAKVLRPPRSPSDRILHVHWIWLKNGRQGRLLRALRAAILLEVARLRGWTIVWTVHNLTPHESRGLDDWVRRRLLRRVHGFICHSQAAARKLAATPSVSRPIAQIPHGHYLDAYPPGPDRAEARSRLGLDGSGPIFLFLGQVRPYKGVAKLVRAFRLLRPEGARLIVAGRVADADHGRELESLAAADSRIRLVDRLIPDAEIGTYLAAADWVVLPFERVTTSGSLILALGAGRPVIIPRHPELLEVTGERAALAFDGTEEDLAATLEGAASSDPEPAGQAARSRAERLDWPTIARQSCAFFRALADS